jgi:hypothetical protein
MVKIQLESYFSTHLSTSHIYVGSLEVLLTATALANCVRESIKCWGLRSKISRSSDTYMVAWAASRQGARGLVIGSGDGLRDWQSMITNRKFATANDDAEWGRDTLLDADDARCHDSVAVMYRTTNAQPIEHGGWINRSWTVKFWRPGAVTHLAHGHLIISQTWKSVKS